MRSLMEQDRKRQERVFSLCQEFFLVQKDKKERFFSEEDKEKKNFLLREAENLSAKNAPDSLSFSDEKIRLFIAGYQSIRELEGRIFAILSPFQEKLEQLGLSLLSLGVDPWTNFSIESYEKTEEKEKRICQTTAGLYLGFTLFTKEDREEKTALAQVLWPIFTALFDTSKSFKGKEYKDFVLRQELLREKEGGDQESFVKGDFFYLSSIDSLPKELALGAAALILGLFSSKKNQLMLESRLLPSKADNTRRGKDSARDNGLQGYYLSDYFVNWGMDFLWMAKKALKKEDSSYLDPLYKLWSNLKAPRDLRLF